VYWIVGVLFHFSTHASLISIFRKAFLPSLYKRFTIVVFCIVFLICVLQIGSSHSIASFSCILQLFRRSRASWRLSQRTLLHGALRLGAPLVAYQSLCTAFKLLHDKYILTVRLGQSQWPRGLRRGSAAAHLLGLRVPFPPGAWMSVCCECCVLSGRGLCVGLITRPEKSFRVLPVIVKPR